MTELFGLPAHMFFIHIPVVLLPLVVIFCSAVLLRPSWRRVAGRWAILSSAVVVVSVFFARESGEGLTEVLSLEKAIERHEELANQTFVLSILFFLIVTATVVLSRKPSTSAVVVRALGAATVVVGVLAFIWTVRTGHEGVAVTWDGWN